MRLGIEKFIVSKQERKHALTMWMFSLIAFYIASSYLGWHIIHGDKMSAKEHHDDALSTYREEKGKTQVDLSILNSHTTKKVVKVSTGIYVDRIVELSTKGTAWTVDFYIWFNWKAKNFNPGDNFQVINGEIDTKEKLVDLIEKKDHYQLYRVKAIISKPFNVVRYPLDQHLLTISIEDKHYLWQEMQFIADQKSSDLSSRVYVSGYNITATTLLMKPHAYKTSRGNPNIHEEQSIYSQLLYAIEIERSGFGLYMKMFQGLFAAVTIALLAFFFAPAEQVGDRMGLGVGAFFAAVANGYISLGELPGAGLLTLTDMINGQGLFTIAITILASIISMRISALDNGSKRANKFDRVSFFIISIGFTAVILSISMAAII